MAQRLLAAARRYRVEWRASRTSGTSPSRSASVPLHGGLILVPRHLQPSVSPRTPSPPPTETATPIPQAAVCTVSSTVVGVVNVRSDQGTGYLIVVSLPSGSAEPVSGQTARVAMPGRDQAQRAGRLGFHISRTAPMAIVRQCRSPRLFPTRRSRRPPCPHSRLRTTASTQQPEASSNDDNDQAPEEHAARAGSASRRWPADRQPASGRAGDADAYADPMAFLSEILQRPPNERALRASSRSATRRMTRRYP